MWVIEGKLNEDGTSSIDPSSATRYPLELEYQGRPGDPAQLQRLQDKLHRQLGHALRSVPPVLGHELRTAASAHSASMVATANCDDIAFYGAGLKLVGMSDFDTGKMYVRAGTEIRQRITPPCPTASGSVALTPVPSGITADFPARAEGGSEHVYSIMLVDKSGSAAPLYYTADTHTAANADGTSNPCLWTSSRVRT
jgi:hypothetical protein